MYYSQGTYGRPQDRLADWDYFLEELSVLEQKLGRLPTVDDLKTEAGRLVWYGILRFHGTLEAVYRRKAFEAKATLSYWRSWRHTRLGLMAINSMIVHRDPTSAQKKRMEKIGLLTALYAFHGGIVSARRRIREEWSNGDRPDKPKEFWRVKRNVQYELLALIRALGHFPTDYELNGLDLYSQLGAIVKYHGGLRDFAIHLGYNNFPKPGYYKKWPRLSERLREITDCLGYFPDTSEIWDFGLISAVNNYNGGIMRVRSRMGYGKVTSKTLRERAQELVPVFFALQDERSGLYSDDLWTAIKDNWSEVKLGEALVAFAAGDLSVFHSLIL